MKRWLGVVASLAILGVSLAVPGAVADDPNPGRTSTTDNYALLDGSLSSKMGFMGLEQTNYLGGNSDFTIEMWIKPDSSMSTGDRVLIYKLNMFLYSIAYGTFRFQFYNSGWKSSINTGVSARYGEWQHIAYVKSGNIMNFYLNGVLAYTLTDATNIPTTPTAQNTYLAVGASPFNDAGVAQSTPQKWIYAGGLDEIRVWTTARTESQIQATMNIRPTGISGLASYWDFNGSGSDSYIYDRGGYVNFGIYGTPKPSFPDVKTTTTSGIYSITTFPRTYISGVGGWTVPSHVTRVDALVVGGGGGGAGNTAANFASAGGGGGGGGAYYATNLAVSETVSVTVGTGGFGGKSQAVGSIDGAYGGQGRSSSFGAISAGGGGGAGNDSASNETRQNGLAGTAGGGGGGASNFRNAYSAGSGGTGSPVTIGGTTYPAQDGGAGRTFASGATVGTAGPGGGATGSANYTSTPSSAYTRGAGLTNSITGSSVVYGVGGGTYGVSGWTFSATTTVAGQGGDGSYNTTTQVNGAPGAAGTVIIKYLSASSLGAIVVNSTVYKGVSTTLSVTASGVGKVTFYANGKRIANCLAVATAASAPYTATCNWKPAVQGTANLTATFTPTVLSTGSAKTELATLVAKRTTKR